MGRWLRAFVHREKQRRTFGGKPACVGLPEQAGTSSLVSRGRSDDVPAVHLPDINARCSSAYFLPKALTTVDEILNPSFTRDDTRLNWLLPDYQTI